MMFLPFFPKEIVDTLWIQVAAWNALRVQFGGFLVSS